MSQAGSADKAVERVVIVGSGPAGWTAAIYAARANLNPIVYEGVPTADPAPILPGGQLMLTTEVENYPGFPKGVTGPELMQLLREQAERFGTRIVRENIDRCDFGSHPFSLSTSGGTTLRTHSVILAMGATANWMGQANELRLATTGGGVSACAVCDGALPVFRDQPLAVVGGGDTAMEEASYLAKFASRVFVIHRRDALRASKSMQDRVLRNSKIEVVWNNRVSEVLGDAFIEGVELTDTVTGAKRVLPVKGLFIAIGHSPATRFLAGSGVALDAGGYIALSTRSSATNIDGVFAAGDVADSVYKQAISAAGMGCQAAIDCERWLAARGVH
ncbi:MAG: thioredoxin-disulfide reductase [Planctomycetota bacterium]|nr:thioredoxin-disulfide reductase [Planctomycetota bacterium]